MSTATEPRLRDMLGTLVRHSPRYVRLMKRLLADERLSALDKAPLVGAIGYGISPIDLVPGIVPVFGQLDDMAVMLGAIRFTLNRIPDDVANEHLMSVGLIRADVDDDIANCRRSAKRIVKTGFNGAARVITAGAGFSFRLAQAGVRGWRNPS